MKWLKVGIFIALGSVVFVYCNGPSKKELNGEIITWKPIPGVAGYRVKIGKTIGDYSIFKSRLVRNTIFYVDSLRLAPGTYWAIVTSENWAGVESQPTKPMEIVVQ
jgi:hypothetical protein